VALLLAPACLPVLVGCTTDANPGLYILQNQVPEPEDGVCLVPAERGQVRQTQGIYDVGLDRGYGYQLYPLVSSALPETSEGALTELNLIAYEGVEVEIEPPPGITVNFPPECPAEFDYPDRFTLAPGEDVASIVNVMLECHSVALRALFPAGQQDRQFLFSVSVRAKGRHGNDTIRSEPFEYPVNVCFGCLQKGFGAGLEDLDFPALANCDNLAANPYIGNPCNIAQDSGPVLCCARQGNPNDVECPGRPRLDTSMMRP
jgi:hypothetical protein